MEYLQHFESYRERYTSIIWSVLIIGILLLTCYVYWPGLTGIFMLDDLKTLGALNKYGGVNTFDGFLHYITDGVGVMGRPMSMMSFLIDDDAFPGDPAKYKYTNLMIHLLIGSILLLMLLKLSHLLAISNAHRNLIAISIFALWLLHPLNVSTTLYVVQRMTQLMSLFVMAGLASYVYGRFLLASQTTKKGVLLMTMALVLFGSLAALSKENGILICLYILVIEFTLARNLPVPAWFKYWKIGFLMLPMVFVVVYFASNWGAVADGYNSRDFNLAERLLTECRILVSYLYQILIPPSGKTGIYHDDIIVSTSLINPLSTLAAVAFVLISFIVAVRLRQKQPVLSFSILWFYAGHSIESTFVPLELYFEHRNYLPMIGPLIGLVYYCYTFAFKVKGKLGKYAISAIPLVFITFSAAFTFLSASNWGKPEIMYGVWYREHPESLRASTMFAQVLERRGLFKQAKELLESTYEKNPDAVALLVYLLDVSCQSNLPPKYNISDIVKASKHGTSRNVLEPVTRKLVSTVRNSNCSFLKTEDLIPLLTSLENVQRLAPHSKVQILLLLTDLYIEKGRLSPAIETLDRAYRVQTMPVLAVRQAELLMGAGLLDEALHYIKVARKADENRRLFKPSYAQIIDVMEKTILSKMENV